MVSLKLPKGQRFISLLVSNYKWSYIGHRFGRNEARIGRVWISFASINGSRRREEKRRIGGRRISKAHNGIKCQRRIRKNRKTKVNRGKIRKGDWISRESVIERIKSRGKETRRRKENRWSSCLTIIKWLSNLIIGHRRRGKRSSNQIKTAEVGLLRL